MTKVLKRSCELCVVAILALSTARSEEISFKTSDGREFQNATLSRIDPAGISVMTNDGIQYIEFANLPVDLQKRFNYDAAKANSYRSAVTRAQKQLAAAREASPTPLRRPPVPPHHVLWKIAGTVVEVSNGGLIIDASLQSQSANIMNQRLYLVGHAKQGALHAGDHIGTFARTNGQFPHGSELLPAYKVVNPLALDEWVPIPAQ